MSSTIAPPPLSTPLTENDGITQNWADWLIISLLKRLQAASFTVAHPVEAGGTITASNQSASISPTAFPLTTINEGFYKVYWTARATTAAGVSSSLTITVAYTRLGVSCTQTSAAMVSNATNLPASGVMAFRSDGGSAITYATTYMSAGSPDMVYELDLSLDIAP